MNKAIQTSGKRKKAVARVTLREGKGRVTINNSLLSTISSEMVRLKIQEPLMLGSESADKVDIEVSVEGGGVISQADAIRLAIAKALVELNPKLKKTFLDYDRTLLVADVRQREARKPNTRGNARAKVQKSYR